MRALQILGYRKVKHNPRFRELRHIEAGVDNGVTVFYKYLDHRFPGSKFVLTMRDLDDWLPSLAWENDRRPVSSSRSEEETIMRRMLLYETVDFDRKKAIAAYERHHADVRRYFADRPDDMLEMRIMEGEGWETLCPFLGVPIPNVDFPHLNQRP